MINIIPVPKKLTKKEGTFSLENVSVFTDDCADRRVVRALTELCAEISERTGEVCPLYSAEPDGRAIKVTHTVCDTFMGLPPVAHYPTRRQRYKKGNNQARTKY